MRNSIVITLALAALAAPLRSKGQERGPAMPPPPLLIEASPIPTALDTEVCLFARGHRLVR